MANIRVKETEYNLWLGETWKKQASPLIFCHHNDVFAVGVLAYFDWKT
jgi:hypothetical protein